MSPELTLRPSLSVLGTFRKLKSLEEGVAGANAPAFVERLSVMAKEPLHIGVAGANAPAFVERLSVMAKEPLHIGVAGANAPAWSFYICGRGGPWLR